MAIKKYKPTSPGRRDMTVSAFEEITTNVPEKSLLDVRKRNAGRNDHGRITVRHRGGGAKRKYRIIDFKRNKDGVPAKVATIEYDPNRTANIALLHYADGEKRYILAPFGLRVGDSVLSGEGADIKPGNSLKLQDIPMGTLIHNIELKPGKGGQLVRSAGSAAQLMAKEGKYAQVRLPSGEVRMVLLEAKSDDRPGGQYRPEQYQHRQSGPQTPYGISPDRTRQRDEPERPSARRRRGQIADRQAGTGDTVGQADAGV